MAKFACDAVDGLQVGDFGGHVFQKCGIDWGQVRGVMGWNGGCGLADAFFD